MSLEYYLSFSFSPPLVSCRENQRRSRTVLHFSSQVPLFCRLFISEARCVCQQKASDYNKVTDAVKSVDENSGVRMCSALEKVCFVRCKYPGESVA